MPNSNTLYIIFVEPNVVVDLGNGENSINTFGAYHGSYSITLNGAAAPVRYAVVPYAGSSGFLNDAGKLRQRPQDALAGNWPSTA